MRIKNISLFFLIGLFTLFALSNCSVNYSLDAQSRNTPTPIVSQTPALNQATETTSTDYPTPTLENSFRNAPQMLPYGIAVKNAQGFLIEMRSAVRVGEKVNATVCFTLPSDEDWQFITQQTDVRLSVGQNDYPVHSGSLVGDSIENRAGLIRCNVLSFIVPLEQDLTEFSIIVHRLETHMSETPDCGEVQEKLTRKKTGIVIQCLSKQNSFDYNILQKPAGMSDDSVRLIVYQEGFTNTIRGPWVFTTGLFVTGR